MKGCKTHNGTSKRRAVGVRGVVFMELKELIEKYVAEFNRYRDVMDAQDGQLTKEWHTNVDELERLIICRVLKEHGYSIGYGVIVKE